MLHLIASTSFVLLSFITTTQLIGPSQNVILARADELRPNNSKLLKLHNGWQFDTQPNAPPDTDEAPIVINSVHSGIKHRNAVHAASLRPTSQFAYTKPPLSLNATETGSHYSEAAPNQTRRSGLHYPYQFQAAQQQPSQDFESAPTNLHSNHHRVQPAPIKQHYKWPTKQQSSKDYYGVSAAPQFTNKQHHQPAWSSQSQPAVENSYQPNANFHQVIRDTSELDRAQSVLTATIASATVAESANNSSWMQSVRDNHNGQLRSRYSLSYNGQNFNNGAQQNRYPTSQEHDNAINGNNVVLFDGLMKAKLGPTLQSSLSVPYEQQAKSVRESTVGDSTPISGTTTSSGNSDFSRRNSKFTREADEATTPVNNETFTITGNQHAPKTNSLKTSTTTAPIPSNESLSDSTEQITGSGHVVALNETDLLVLSQKFDLDANQSKNASSSSNATMDRNSVKDDESVEKVTSNNHTTKQKLLNSTAPVRQKTGRKLTSSFQDQSSQDQGRQINSWSRLLPNLIHRTLGNMFRKLTGSGAGNGPKPMNQQPQVLPLQQATLIQPATVQYPVPSFASPASQAGFNFLGSAFSAAAAAAAASSRPSPLLDKPSILGSANDPLEQQLGGASSINRLQHNADQLTNKLKQHANKKIIDSAIDLPVSERRSSLDKRHGLDSTQVSDSKLKAEPRRRRRSSKTDSEWKSEDQSESDDDLTTSDDSSAVVSAPLNARQDSEYDEDIEESTFLVADANDQLDYRTTTAKPSKSMDSLSPDLDTSDNIEGARSNDDDDMLETSDSSIDEQSLPLTEEKPLYYSNLNLFDSTTDESDDLSAQDSSNDDYDQHQQLFLYSPKTSLSGPSLRRVNGGSFHRVQVHSNHNRNSNRHRKKPVRAKPEIVFSDDTNVSENEEDSLEGQQDSYQIVHQNIRRKRPQSQMGAKKKKKPGLIVPAISLQHTKPPPRTPIAKPISIFAGPTMSDGNENNGDMLSPMSSSINVMDLDPSMTKLAHNKLIVARYKPAKSQMLFKNNKVADSATRNELDLVTRAQGILKRTGIPTGNNSTATTSSTTKRPAALGEPVLASIPALLGTQVITNTHINDIISRWTKSASSTTARPLKQDSAINNSSRSDTDQSTSSLRLVNDGLQSFMPFASSLAARFSFPTNQNKFGSAFTSSTTTTIKPPISFSLKDQPYKSDKFNFSLVQMNNRERINPLLFPVDHQNSRLSQASISNSTLAKHKQNNNNIRSRLGSSTTTLRPTNTVVKTSQPQMAPTTSAAQLRTTQIGSSTTVVNDATTTPSHNLVSKTTSITTTTTTNPPAVKQVLSDNKELPAEFTGQILRSQHHSLRNTTNLDARLSSVQRPQQEQETTLSAWNSDLSGHITVVSPNNMAELASGNDLEDGVQDSNKYLTLENHHQPPSVSNQPVDDHSIVIMSDNHHQLRKRKPVVVQPSTGSTKPTFAADQQPALSALNMWYSSSPSLAIDDGTSSIDIETTTPASATVVNSAQVALKYLEEFVNGSRIRPSSTTKLTTTTTPEPSLALNSLKNDSSMLIMMSNHHHSNVSSFDSVRKQAGALNRNNSSFAFNSAKGSPSALASQSDELIGKLDDKTHELLLDIFDRDPSYANSLGNLEESINGNNNSDVARPTTAGETPASESDNLLNSYTKAKTQSFDSMSITHYTSAESLTSPVTPARIEDKLSDYESTPAYADLGDDKPGQARSTAGSIRHVTTSSSTTPMPTNDRLDEPLQKDEYSDNGSRASMRKNQAKIQAILAALAKKRNNSTAKVSTTTASSANEEAEELSEMDKELSSVSPPVSTTPSEDQIYSSTATTPAPDEMSSKQGYDHQTTRLYAPKATTLATIQVSGATNHQQPQRYPNVETVSSSRQKINRPSADYGSSHENFGWPSIAPTPNPITSTTKLTESVTNDGNLKQTIGNRITPLISDTNHVKLDSDDSSGNELLEPEESGPQSSSAATDRRSQNSPSSFHDILAHNGIGSASEIDQPADVESNEYQSERPVIIRRRPSKKPGLQQGQQNQQRRKPQRKPPNKLTMAAHYEHDHSQPTNNKKRRQKPSKRPISTASANEVFVDINDSESVTMKPNANNSITIIGEDNGEPMTMTISQNSQRKPPKQRPQTLVLGGSRPIGSAGQHTTNLIRKRPQGLRLPPHNIRIHENGDKNKTISLNKKPSQSNHQPISLILPSMDSIIKKKDQDIRTKPLTIIDPITDPAAIDNGGAAYNESILNPTILTRIPETTILHNKMVVSYKPGRPLPGQMSSFSSSSSPSRVNGSETSMPTTPSMISQQDGTSQRPTSQLGSGNGGDTLLVSIEQQQAAMEATRRPMIAILNLEEQQQSTQFVTSTTSLPPTTEQTTTSISTTTQQYPPHSRPIIVINGMFDRPSSSHHHQISPHAHKPYKPNLSVESGSMSVIAMASHGNSSSSATKPSAGRNNTSTTSAMPANSTQPTIDLSQDINGTADSVVGPEMPNFGTPSTPSGSSSGFSGPSGSYHNHQQQNQAQNQHIGMPYLGQGGSLTSNFLNSRPGVSNNPARPYRWRVKKKPNGNGNSSGTPYDYSTSGSSISTYFHRPLLLPLSLSNIWDNIVIALTTIGTRLASLMLMFFPPVALAASIVSVMSS